MVDMPRLILVVKYSIDLMQKNMCRADRSIFNQRIIA